MGVRTWRHLLVFGAGLLLGTAAVLKLAAPPPKWFGCWLGLSGVPWTLAAGLELLLALFLLTFSRHPKAWLGVTVFFGAALVATAGLAYRGSETCGCLGSVSAPPIAMAGLDGVWLAGLLWTGRGTWKQACSRSLLGWSVAVVGMVLLVGLPIGMLFDRRAADLAFPFRISVPVASPNDASVPSVDFVVPIINRSDSAVTIHPPLEGPVRVPDGPLTIPPRSRSYLRCRVSVGKGGVFSATSIVWAWRTATGWRGAAATCRVWFERSMFSRPRRTGRQVLFLLFEKDDMMSTLYSKVVGYAFTLLGIVAISSACAARAAVYDQSPGMLLLIRCKVDCDKGCMNRNGIGKCSRRGGCSTSTTKNCRDATKHESAVPCDGSYCKADDSTPMNLDDCWCYK